MRAAGSREQNPLADAFRQQDNPAPTLRVLRRSNLLLTEIRSEHPDLIVTGTVPRDDAYVVTLHLRDRPKGAMCAEGRWIEPQNFASGHAGVVDLRLKLVSEYAGAFHYVSFYLKQAALQQVAADAGDRRFGDLRHRAGVGFSDPVVRHLLLSLRPLFDAEAAELSAVYADHVALAFVTHMATHHGGLRAAPAPKRGGLAAWQERRAKDLLDAHLDGEITLAELARECQLSVRHFARAFRESTGQSPHRWLIGRRLDRAQSLLHASASSLHDVANACGFASQSHFTRTFKRATGVSPGAWRRQRRG